jgi:predicted MFS family arabinose efflux permease
MSGIAAGQIAGIPLGNLLADWFGYKTPFLAFAGVAAIAWVLIRIRLPQPDVELSDRLSLSGALKGYGRLLKRTEVRAAAAAYVMMFMGLSLYVTFFPTWLEHDLHFSAAMVSLVYFVGGSANVLVGPQAGKLSDRIGRTGVIIIASIGVAILMPLISLLDSQHGWMVFPLFFITMGMVASRMSPMQALLTQMTSGAQRGALMSLVTSIGQIGFGIGSAFASVTWQSWGFSGTAVVSMISVLMMAWIVWQFLRNADRREREVHTTDAPIADAGSEHGNGAGPRMATEPGSQAGPGG